MQWKPIPQYLTRFACMSLSNQIKYAMNLNIWIINFSSNYTGRKLLNLSEKCFRVHARVSYLLNLIPVGVIGNHHAPPFLILKIIFTGQKKQKTKLKRM